MGYGENDLKFCHHMNNRWF